MYKERIDKLIDHLETLPEEKYNQSFFIHPYHSPHCGTPSCIAGHTIALFGREKNFNVESDLRDVGELLGLDKKQSLDLFDEDPIKHRRVTRADAIWALMSLLKTGEVHWLQT